MDDSQLAGGAPSDVLITEGMAINFHAHLAEQGRNVGGAQDVALLLHKAVEKAWGTKDAPRFTDDVGGGWIIDLSPWLDGELLYAQIRTLHGRRTLTTVVTTEEYEAFVKDGKWQSSVAANPEAALVDPEALKEAEAIENKRALTPTAQPGAAPIQKQGINAIGAAAELPDDPMLVVCKSDLGVDRLVRCTRADVPKEVQELLTDGIDEGDIEIWSRVTKPKVTIQF